MEATYTDRYREELSDIFSRIVKIEIYFVITLFLILDI